MMKLAKNKDMTFSSFLIQVKKFILKMLGNRAEAEKGLKYTYE